MKPERNQRIEKLIEAVKGLSPAERTVYLTRECEGDTLLQEQIETLLLAQADARGLTSGTESSEETLSLTQEPTMSQSRYEQVSFPSVRNIGPYRVLRRIGEGGMGAVYLAERDDEAFKKRVAIKLVKGGMDGDFIIRRFRNERQILASLDHPYIARLLDGGSTEEGIPYFVMEYIEGKSITDYCAERDLPVAARLKLFQKVCAAVHYAHKNLVVHRDIKPGNILVTADGTPKLLDFGIAKLLKPELSGLSLDLGATAMGMMTPEYASPEQVRGDNITTASDIYSLGIVLYELLTGRKPYRLKSRTPQEIVRVICEQEPSKPSSAVTGARAARDTISQGQQTARGQSRARRPIERPDRLRRRLEGDLDNIVLMALRKEPDRRYASADQLLGDIQRHLDGRPVIARKDTLSYRAGKFIRRNRLAVASASLIVLMLAGGLVAINAERGKAERRFNDVRHLANSFMFEIHDAIESLPGATPARELLVKKSLEYLDTLAREGGGASLQRELAQAYLKVGDVQGYPFEANLGDTAGALESYRKALAISESLAASDGSNVEIQRDLITAYERVGDVLMAKGDTAGSLESHRKSLSIAEELSAAYPADNKIRRNLIVSILKVGEALAQAGGNDAALAEYRKGLEFARVLAEADPASFTARRDLTVLYNKVGDVLVATGDSAGGLEHYRKALALREASAAEYPNNAQARRDVATNNEKVAAVLLANGDAAGALAYQRKALASDEALAAADPSNIDAQFDLGISYSNIAQIMAKAGGHETAIETYRKSISILESITARNPDNAEMRYELADSYVKLGREHLATGDLPRATGLYERARAILEPLHAGDPVNVEFAAALAEAYYSLGEARERSAQLREARSWYWRALDLYEDLAEKVSGGGGGESKVEETSLRISSIDGRLGKK